MLVFVYSIECIGVPCGVMDQFISAMGKEKSVLLIDCRTLEAKPIEFASGAKTPVVIITNSNVTHSLGMLIYFELFYRLDSSQYSQRVKQCKSAVVALQHFYEGRKSTKYLSYIVLNF